MGISHNGSCADDIYYQYCARMVRLVHKLLWENVNFYLHKCLSKSDNVDVIVVSIKEKDQDQGDMNDEHLGYQFRSVDELELLLDVWYQLEVFEYLYSKSTVYLNDYRWFEDFYLMTDVLLEIYFVCYRGHQDEMDYCQRRRLLINHLMLFHHFHRVM